MPTAYKAPILHASGQPCSGVLFKMGLRGWASPLTPQMKPLVILCSKRGGAQGESPFPLERRFGRFQLDDDNLYAQTFTLEFDFGGTTDHYFS